MCQVVTFTLFSHGCYHSHHPICCSWPQDGMWYLVLHWPIASGCHHTAQAAVTSACQMPCVTI